MRREHRKELKRLREALAKTPPGTAEYDKLLDEIDKFVKSLVVEKNSRSKLCGMSKDTLIACLFGVGQLVFLAKAQDEKFLPKNLFSFLIKPKH